MELHPDRNFGNSDDSTKLFAEIQVAYDVLSDPHERAWYDSHEAQFLDDDNIDGSNAQFTQDLQFKSGNDILQIMRNFHGAVIFTDRPTGFFGFLRNTFASLAKEEMEAVAKQGFVPSVEYPSFGYESDKYESTVKQFYTVWSNFATQKTFRWKEFYKYKDAPDRRYRRAMEKENKRLREDGIREFNDSVRALVSFVRKRDPRYIPSKQTETERQNTLRDIAAAQAARSRAANEAKLGDQVLPEWVVAREPEEQMVSDEHISEEEHFECVACGKTFKSEKQFWTHESSKKHQKTVYALKKQMRRENMTFHLEDDENDYDKSGSEPENIIQHGNATSGDENRDSQEYDKTESIIENYISKNLTHTDLETAVIETRLTDRQNIEKNEQDADDVEEIKDYLADSSDLKLAECDTADTLSASPRAKQGKAALKRAKRANQQAESKPSDPQHTCGACGSTFPSRTRMFQHISDNKHETPNPKSKKGGKDKRKKH